MVASGVASVLQQESANPRRSIACNARSDVKLTYVCDIDQHGSLLRKRRTLEYLAAYLCFR